MKLLGYIIAVIVLSGVAYAIMTYAPVRPIFTWPEASTSPTQQVRIETKTIHDETDAYVINVEYPQFGIAPLDARILQAVEAAVTQMKGYPANPADSAAAQNSLDGNYSVVYMDDKLASVKLVFSEYTGGAHPNSAIVSINMHLASGAEVTLDEALAMTGMTLSQVAESSLAQLKTRLGEDAVFTEGTQPLPENYATFFITADSVTFVFQNYQVAAYAAGQQEVRFPRVR